MMLTGIKFNGNQFNHRNDNNAMYELTGNTIMLCETVHTKNTIAGEILKICKGQCEAGIKGINDYVVPEEQKNYPEITEYIMGYLPTTIYKIDYEQTITLSLEASFILQAQAPEDIWFASEDKKKISVYPFTCFPYYQEVWLEGLLRVYRDYCGGRFGSYQGYWFRESEWQDTMKMRKI